MEGIAIKKEPEGLEDYEQDSYVDKPTFVTEKEIKEEIKEEFQTEDHNITDNDVKAGLKEEIEFIDINDDVKTEMEIDDSIAQNTSSIVFRNNDNSNDVGKKRIALMLKLEKNERRWQVIAPAPDTLSATRVNLERSTEDVPETTKTDIQLETENQVSSTASTNADSTIIDPLEVPTGLMDVEAWVNMVPDQLLPTLFMDTESTTKNVPKTSKTDLIELQPLSDNECLELGSQEDTENLITPSAEFEVTDEEDQDPFHNSDDDEVDPNYNSLSSGSESDNECRNVPATGIEIENANEPITKKRKRGKINKRTLAKKMRNCGKEYESKTRGRVNKRSMKPPCHNCKLKCTEKIDENYRKELFEMFWGMGDLQRQREFIKDSTQEVVPRYQRITLNRKRERGSNQSYSIKKDEEKIRVCKQFFKNTFDLSDRAIRTTFEKIDKSTGVLSLEMRGKHGRHQMLDKELVKSAKDHIEKISRIPSHYCRSQTSRQYIDGGKSIAEHHRDYLKERKESNLAGISYCQYRAIFKSYNLSFFTPKKKSV